MQADTLEATARLYRLIKTVNRKYICKEKKRHLFRMWYKDILNLQTIITHFTKLPDFGDTFGMVVVVVDVTSKYRTTQSLSRSSVQFFVIKICLFLNKL